MVLFFPGRSRCKICGEVINSPEEMTGFTAFIPYEHELGRFSDAAVHTTCFEQDPDRDAVLALLARWEAIMDTRPRDVTDRDAIDAWGREAFKDYP